MSWYRQYRPTTISALDLKAVRGQLEKLMAGKTFPHAILLTGPRGAGKTSTARIIAATVNDPANSKGPPFSEPNPKEEVVQRIIQGNSLAVHELDAASNRGIDDVRALREQAYLPPQEGSTLVFILDEVHMLTTEAFNALLKLLEEPPARVIFILATTEEHKVPATIISRCTVVRFTKATPAEVEAALQPIIKDQKLDIDPEALAAITHSVDGSFRDAVKLLETVAAGVKKISLEHVHTYLRSTPTNIIYQLIDAIIGKDEQEVVKIFEQLRSANTDQKQFYQHLLSTLHQDLITSITSPKEAKYQKRISQFLLAQFSSVEINQLTPIPLLPLELKALELVFRAQDKKGGSSGNGASDSPQGSSRSSQPMPPKSQLASTTEVEDVLQSEPDLSESETVSDTVDKVVSLPTAPIGDSALSMLLIEKWNEYILVVQQQNSSLAALLRSGRASLTANGTVCIEVYYQFHRDQLRQPKFLKILEDGSLHLLGQTVRFEFQLAKNSQVSESISTVSVPNTDNDQLIQLAQEVFL